MTDPHDPIAADPAQGASPRQGRARQGSAWQLLLPAILLPAWFALGYAGFELAWRLHIAWRPQDGGRLLEYWRGGMNAARLLMAIPPMLAALPLAMILANFLLYRLPAARRAGGRKDGAAPGADYAVAQRDLVKFAAAVAAAAALLAAIGAWLG